MYSGVTRSLKDMARKSKGLLLKKKGGTLESKPHSTTNLINMHEAHKALATRSPPSRHLPSKHSPLAFIRVCPKHRAQNLI